MSQIQNSNSPTSHLRSDLAMFAGVFVIVISGVAALYAYDLKTGYLVNFASQLFHWLID